MHVRALAIIAVLPIAMLSLPSTAHAQRVTTQRCWSGPDWRDVEACNRSYAAEVARAARREASEERARLRNIDNADRVARARERRFENEARTREVAREATARAQERAWANEDRRREQVDRARERASERARERQMERAFDRPTRYQRWP